METQWTLSSRRAHADHIKASQWIWHRCNDAVTPNRDWPDIIGTHSQYTANTHHTVSPFFGQIVNSDNNKRAAQSQVEDIFTLTATSTVADAQLCDSS